MTAIDRAKIEADLAEARKWNHTIGDPLSRINMTNGECSTAVIAIEEALDALESLLALVPESAELESGEAGFKETAENLKPEPAEDERNLIATEIQSHGLGEDWGDDGIGHVGCGDCGYWFGKASEGGWDRAFEHVADAILARGFRLRALPSREEIAEAVKDACHTTTPWGELAADAVLALLDGKP